MKVLIVGGGGREHALVWKISMSKGISEIFCAPGNGGISDLATCIPINPEDIEGLVEFSKKEGIDLVIVGPESPLALGIVDKFSQIDIPVFGPKKDAALIETSKIYAKEIMKKYNVPTANYASFSNHHEASLYVDEKDLPFVIKADGLCGGKGAYIIRDRENAHSVLEDLFIKKIHGSAGERIVIEDFLVGEEVSYLVFSDGKEILPLVPSQDHKRLLDNDEGPNTGGMGAYTPVPFVDSEMENTIKNKIMTRMIEGLREEGIEYKGILYGGLIVVSNSPYVLEFNARFGDPETQAILFKMESDLLPIIISCINGTLGEIKEIKWKKGYTVCVVIASRGYPEKPEKDKIINGLESLKNLSDVMVFHAGSKKINGKYYTSGGRVLNIVARGDNLKEAIRKAYEAVSMIHFEGMHYRKDIGQKAFKYLN
ncbi:MAG: phosphoribosylamine--glycine ligase [Deltaproteobacteria bacterium]|nr:phosphoribosylamine--glycine ligase [Deltaproteobacteria bacterium]